MSVPSISPNTDVCCPICMKAYATANNMFTLTCAAEGGCRADLCFDCLNKAVFNGAQEEAKCPHCRRTVGGYEYAAFSLKRKVDEMHERFGAADTALKDARRESFELRARVEALQHDVKSLQTQCAERSRKIRRAEQLLRTAEETTLEAERAKTYAETAQQTLYVKNHEWENWAHGLDRVFTSMPLRWSERGA